MGLASYRRSISESKRASILKAARENFLADGYSRAAMAEIAKGADVSTATLYKHFSSKEELFAAVVHATYTDTKSLMAMDIRNMPAAEVLKQLGDAYVYQQFDGQMNELLRVVIAEVPSSPHLAREVYEKSVLRRYREVKDIIEALVARGDLKPHDTDESVLCLAGMVKEFVVWPALFAQNFKKPDDVDEKIGVCIGAFLKIYQA
ncbi:transcriptional regulator, TetR family [Parvibaculum lavamentivorans DS-1]|uniref:Transcriptional regulator, TetR family n=1 Tax=Parvibaculum lavamentivorans (strain DS-1 / DSM 13023 / NCIMB 13966) TaxID=402881 RepID=A7HVH4_PARL1|nr:TetR/AcrR family transcriptional regulator [Parvibaculum lavamentivorans]ABS63907.1 transcriptional regulator, TetR family [Parvibaculum lavamentivorans DS-1]